MNPLVWKMVWHCADGTSFFVGTAMLLAGILISSLKIRIRNLIIYPLVLVGAAGIFLSATPLPSWFYILWAVATIFCLSMFGYPLYCS